MPHICQVLSIYYLHRRVMLNRAICIILRYLMCIYCGVNVSQGNGGALALLGVHAHSYVATSTFEDCTSALSGGAMWVSHFVTYPSNPLLSTIKIESCTFEGNTATKGGAFTVVGDHPELAIQEQHGVTGRRRPRCRHGIVGDCSGLTLHRQHSHRLGPRRRDHFFLS